MIRIFDSPGAPFPVKERTGAYMSASLEAPHGCHPRSGLRMTRQRSSRIGRSAQARIALSTSLTITRSSFRSRLSSDDLPAFGLPTIATDTPASVTVRCTSWCSLRLPSCCGAAGDAAERRCAD